MRVVITGGPCSGKTTLVQELAARGYRAVPEAAIIVIEDLNRSLGVEEQKRWRLGNLTEFQRRVFSKQLELEAQALDGVHSGDELVFFDRGYLDGLAYCHYFEVQPPAELLAAVETKRYDIVFVLSTLVEFVSRGDQGRTSDREKSIALCEALERTYREHGYSPFRVDVAPVGERADFVLGTISQL